MRRLKEKFNNDLFAKYWGGGAVKVKDKLAFNKILFSGSSDYFAVAIVSITFNTFVEVMNTANPDPHSRLNKIINKTSDLCYSGFTSAVC